MSAEEEVYVLSSKGGVSIPFDIGDPIGSFVTAFTAAASALKTLNAAALNQLAILYSDSKDVAVRFGDQVPAFTNDTWVSDQVIVLAGRPTAIIVRDLEFKTISTGNGNLSIQVFRKWETLDKEILQART